MSERATQVLIIVNDGPYGSERAYNALRLAMNLIKRPQAAVRLFLIGDGVACAHKGQRTPDGYYNVERMIRSVVGEARSRLEAPAWRPAGSGQKTSSKAYNGAASICWGSGRWRPTEWLRSDLS